MGLSGLLNPSLKTNGIAKKKKKLELNFFLRKKLAFGEGVKGVRVCGVFVVFEVLLVLES